MSKISEEGKRRRKRGTGHGAKYKPWILARELNSLGTTANVIDWKHGRVTELLSAAEESYYYYLRWDDNVIDIREQFPLDLPSTVEIAQELGIRHPHDNFTTMTTDLFVDFSDGSQVAYSVKASREDVDYKLCTRKKDIQAAQRTAEKLLIEKTYWERRKISWRLVYKEDLNPMTIDNIRRCVLYYDSSRIHDDISKIKHLIARKKIQVDLSKEIDYQTLICAHLHGGTIC